MDMQGNIYTGSSTVVQMDMDGNPLDDDYGVEDIADEAKRQAEEEEELQTKSLFQRQAEPEEEEAEQAFHMQGLLEHNGIQEKLQEQRLKVSR
jgi:phage-related minor tail protein